MTAMLDPVTETDLDAYVDDQLDVARRIEVEAFLSTRPEAAARVMSDLRTRDELRLALAGSKGLARPATTEAARRLERGLARGRIFGVLQRAAAVAVFVAAGWLANEIVGPMSVTEVVASTPPPAYVEEAMRAHRTSIVRASMASQPEVPDYDADEIRAATAIVMPTLPKNWQVRDVQVFPSQFGPERRDGGARPKNWGWFHCSRCGPAPSTWSSRPSLPRATFPRPIFRSARSPMRWSPRATFAISIAQLNDWPKRSTDPFTQEKPDEHPESTAIARASAPAPTPSSTRACASTCCASTTTWASASS